MNLNKTWEQCLKMWRWIVRQPCPRHIGSLKWEWLKENGFRDIESECFFCEYDNKSIKPDACKNCPGYKIDKKFGCCNDDYHYYHKPAAFLRKITELNKIRLAKKK